MENKLQYHNEDDRCYGATGMTVAYVVLEGEDLVSGVNLDATPDALLEYVDGYFFAGNPGLSAKSAWTTILNHFNYSMAAVIGNVMCRRYVLDETGMDQEMRDLLMQLMIEEGAEECNLEEDETRRLFDKNYVYLTRVFTHRGVQGVCHEFARALKRQRRMSRYEILDRLRALRML